MSALQDVLVALTAVTTDAERHAADLAQQAGRIGQAASQAAAVTRGSAQHGGEQAAVALQAAQRSVAQAAQQLHAAAVAGKGFVARHGGGGGSAGAPVAVVATSSSPAGLGVHSLPGLPDGFAMIPVGLIDQAENPITGPQDFGKGYSIEDLAHAFGLLEGQVLPGLANGADRDVFAARDQADGASGTRSLSDTYSGFFGDAAIRLEPRPDGTYGITNGRHRVFVASRYGHPYVPARLS